MFSLRLPALLLILGLGFALIGCDQIPEEGTIVYDIDFPRADSDEAQGGGGGGGGGSSNGSTPSGLSTSASVSVTTINEGATDTETFVLSGPPNGTVTITFSSGDTSEATLSPATMSFDNTTWATPQTLTITAPEDYSVDGDQTTTISYTIASTNPTDTLHGASGNFNVVTADSGATAVTVANSSPSVTEGTTNNSTTFALSGPPNGTVTVTITSSDTGEATVSPTTLSFDNTNWNVAQPITLSGVEDYLIDGNQSSTISYTLSSTDTTEPFHNAYGSFSASIVDSGTRLFVVSDDSPTVNEGYSSTITFALDSAPAGTVTVALSSADDNETTVSPTTLTFNSGNYNVAQTITLYGPEDYIIDGNQQTVVSLAVTSTNTGDVVHNVSTSITVTTVDSGLGTTFSLSTATPAVTEGTTDNSTTFVLLSPPKGTVTVTFSSADDNETTVSPNTLTFTPANWNVPQALPLVGVEDFIADGNQTTAMNVSFSSTDSTDGVHGESGSFNVITNDSGITGTFTLSPSTPSVAEGSSNNSSTFVLTSAPNGTVTVTLSSDNSSELGVSPTNLVFTPANWNVPQNFTVTGVEDFNVDGTQSTNVNISYSSSDTTDGIHGQSSSFAVNVTDSGKGATTITSATAGNQQVTLNWSGPAGMSSYTIHYTSNGSTPTTSSDNITITDGTATSYVHAGLTAGLTYTYSIVANLGVDSSALSPTVSAVPTSFAGCTTSGTLSDPDADLLVYYDFNNDLEDQKDRFGDGRYDLSNTGGTIKFAQGCGYNNAAYFDPSTGYAYSNAFIDDNEAALSGNFTTTAWIYSDPDNERFSAAWSSGSSSAKNHQLDVDSGASPTLRLMILGETSVSTSINNHQWYHVAATHNTSNQWNLYINGQHIGTRNASSPATWTQLKIGVNRTGNTPWKGYIDEFKVFGRTFTADNVTESCLLYQECEKYVKPATPTGLTATNPGSGTSINLTWNAVTGADNYTVYWTDDPSTPIDPSTPSTYDGFKTVTGTSTSATGLTANTSYDFTIIATNAAGSSSPATEVNATPTLVLPAAIDNVTAYHGFYGDATIYTASNPDRYSIFPPSYAITWNAHPDFVYSANGDYYKVFISDNLSQPIDPTDSSTYISQQWATTNQTVITTRPFITIDGVTHNDGFLENTPIRIAVVFEDDSKGDILSPVTEFTPTMASEAYRQWGDLRIHGGFFAAGDNSTLYGFGRSNSSYPIRIEHKDMVNVGQRAIFDGAWLNSDVFPLMGNSAGNDFMFLTWYQPAKPFFNHNFSTDGTYFKRSRTSNWRLESNAISAGSAVGDYDFGMEFQAEDTVGLIIQHSSNRTGTLNGPTDYAAVSYADYAAGNGLYSAEHTGTSHWLDNSSYAGMTLFSTKNIYQINLANADAAISKVAIPIPPPDNLSASASGSNMSLSWDNSTVLTNTYSIYRSADNSTWSLVTTLSGYDNNTYTDSSLAQGTYYYKIGANGTYYTSDNSTVASGTISPAPAITLSATTATVRESGNRGDMLWTRTIGDFSDGYVLLSQNAIDSEMNMISAGYTGKSTATTNLGRNDWLIMKHGPSGELIWQKQIGSSKSESTVDVAVDSNDNIYAFGSTSRENGGDFDGMTISRAGSHATTPLWILVKFDKDGNRQWIKQIDKTGSNHYSHARAMDVEGSAIYIAGYSGADGVNQVEKYDLNGNKQASINLTPPTHSDFTTSHVPFINDLDATSNGVFVTVSRRGTRPLIRSELTKLDNNLSSEVWQTVHPGNYEYYAVKGMPNGNIVASSRETYVDGYPRLINIYNSSGSLVTSGAFNQGNTNREHFINSDYGQIAVDSANNILFIQLDNTDRNQPYLVKYNSSGSFVNEKKLPPNFQGRSVSIRQNSAGEEFIYATGSTSITNHVHSYGQVAFNYYGGFVGRISNNSVAPVSSTPGFASIKFEIATESTDKVWVCPKYNNAYITTAVVSDELVVHPAGPMNVTYPTNSNTFYFNSCVYLRKFSHSTIFQSGQLELYALQDNVTDANQDITLSFRVVSNDSTYNGMSIPNVTVTVENAAVPAPNAPLDLKVTTNGTSNTLTWTKPIITGLGEDIQNYTIKWNTDNGSSWTNITGITNDNYTHTGLSGSTTYYYEVFANNQGGAGAVSNRDSATTATVATPAFKYSITGNDNDVSEDGSSDTTTLNLYLDTAPNGNVVVDITVSDATELAIGSTQLTFTPANYGNTQNWSVTGVDDALDDGNVVSQVTIAINGAGTTDTTGYASLSNKNKSITTLDDDAAPVLNSVTAGTQLNALSWNAYSGATAYRIYWSTSSPVTTSSNVIDNISNSATSYQHSGRTAGTTYYYAFVANTSVGFSSLSNELNATPTAFAGCTSSGAVADNDPDLLVHYAFEGNLEDIEDTNSDNRYDLTNSSGTMQYAQSCAQGQAAYIDASSGYGVNTQFTSSNVGGNLANDNFSISLWVAKDGDMEANATALNTGFYSTNSPNNSWAEKTQIDVDSSNKLRWNTNSPSQNYNLQTTSAINTSQWYHIIVTHNNAGESKLYVDGVLDDSESAGSHNAGFYALNVGINRSDNPAKTWKGYIDEVKVFGRTFSVDDVVTDCMKADNCSWVPPTAPTLAGTGRAQAIMLTWNQQVGTDNATIYWRTSGGASEGSPTAPTASDNVINTSDNQTSYLLTGLTGGHYYHFVIKANNKNGSSPVSSVLGNVQPTSFVANTFDTNNGGVCKIQNDKSLHCKGRNNLDQYDNARTARPAAVDVFGITNAETISHDYNKVSVIKSDGSYQHRGYDDSRGSLTSPVTGVSNPIQVEQGYDFVAYLMSNGTIRTRGDNTYGQLGNGSNTNETSGSVQVSGITTAVKIVTGQWHMCALLSNAQVWCWGVNSFGELGDGTTTHRNAPVQASLPSNTAVDIFVGGRTSAAVLSNGKVYTWGSNTNSKAKCSTNTNAISTPRELTVISDVKEIDFGTGHSVILKNNGNVYTCGTNYTSSNVAGNAAFLAGMSSSAEKTNGAILMDDFNGRVVSVRADGSNSYMLLDNGSLACIGDNEYGQCNNDGSTINTDQTTPIIIPDM